VSPIAKACSISIIVLALLALASSGGLSIAWWGFLVGGFTPWVVMIAWAALDIERDRRIQRQRAQRQIAEGLAWSRRR